MFEGTIVTSARKESRKKRFAKLGKLAYILQELWVTIGRIIVLESGTMDQQRWKEANLYRDIVTRTNEKAEWYRKQWLPIFFG